MTSLREEREASRPALLKQPAWPELPDSNFICLQSRNRSRAEQLGRALLRGCAKQQNKLSDGQGEKPTTPRLLCGGEMLQSVINDQHRALTQSAVAAATRSLVHLLLGNRKGNTQRRAAVQMTPGNT